MGAEEVFALADDFGKAAGKVASALYDTFKAEGESFAEDWRKNAEQTSGAHARKYPPTITSETKLSTGIHVETGPEARGQGMLGRVLELGSPTSPAHLDGLGALGPAEERLAKAADATIGFLIP